MCFLLNASASRFQNLSKINITLYFSLSVRPKSLQKFMPSPIYLKGCQAKKFPHPAPLGSCSALERWGCFQTWIGKKWLFLKSQVSGLVWVYYFNVYCVNWFLFPSLLCWILFCVSYLYVRMLPSVVKPSSLYILSLSDFTEFHW